LPDRDPLVTTLSELTRLLLTDFSIEDVLSHLCRAVTRMLPVDGAGVTKIDGGEVRIMRCTDERIEELERIQAELGEGPCTSVIDGGPAAQFDMDASEARWPRYSAAARRLGVRRIAVVPLWGRDRLWGVLDLYMAEDRPLSESEMKATQVIADAATVYVLSAHDRRAAELAEEQLRSQLLHDALTGLPNRVLLADRLQHALSISQRPARSLAVLFVDLDDFKRVNDRHGHQAGDVLLKEVAGRLQAALRHSDTVARLSGDEFVIICENLHDRPLADLNNLAAVGQRILDAFREPIEIGGAQPVVVRASVGAVWAGGTDDTAEDVLHRADVAMYRAKRRGGNRVVVSDHVSSPPDATFTDHRPAPPGR
jgi:diguanylate cyclase (GGDEF)-like protein